MLYQEWRREKLAALGFSSLHIIEARELGLKTMAEFYSQFPEKLPLVRSAGLPPYPEDLMEALGEEKVSLCLDIIRAWKRDDGTEDSLLLKAQSLGLQAFEVRAVQAIERNS